MALDRSIAAVRLDAHIDNDSNIRVLMQIWSDDKPIQTIGSYLVDDPALIGAIKASVYALNSFSHIVHIVGIRNG